MEEKESVQRIWTRNGFGAGAMVVIAVIMYVTINTMNDGATKTKQSRQGKTMCAREYVLPVVCAHGGVVDNSMKNDTTSSRQSEAHDSYMTNTFESFARALEDGLPCVEIDASMTSDGKVVALHSRELRQMMERSGHLMYNASTNVSEHHSRSLQLLDAGGGAKIASLQLILSALCEQIDVIIIDLKLSSLQQEDDDERKTYVDEVVRIVSEECRELKRTRIIFFTKDDLVVPDVTAAIHSREIVADVNYVHIPKDANTRMEPASIHTPRLETGYVVMNGTAKNILDGHHRLVEGRPEDASVAAVYNGMVDTDVVRTIHESNVQVFTWVVDDDDVAIEMMEHEVDGIVSNNPSFILEKMEEHRQYICGDSGSI